MREGNGFGFAEHLWLRRSKNLEAKGRSGGWRANPVPDNGSFKVVKSLGAIDPKECAQGT